MNSPPARATTGVVIFAKSPKKVAAFYRQTLGLTVAEETTSHLLLVGPGIELVIHAIPRAISARITITRPPTVRDETPIKPAFLVADLEAVRAAAAATGGALKPRDGAWHIRGALVLDGWDPEGNVVQFRQVEA